MEKILIITLATIATEEIKAMEEAFQHGRADSRLGWDAELQYFYRPSDVLERLISLDGVVEPMPRALVKAEASDK